MKSFIVTIRRNDSTMFTKRFHVRAVDIKEAACTALDSITNLWGIISIEVLE